MTHEGIAELESLERAIGSLSTVRAPDTLRSTLRRELVEAAASRGATAFPLTYVVRRVAFAAVAALLLATSSWAIAASAPGDAVYPVKELIVRVFFAPTSEELRSPALRTFPALPELFVPRSGGTPVPAPDASTRPASAPLASAAPIVPVPPGGVPPTAAPASPTQSGPAATPAVPPDPPGPRATPAVPPTHR